MLTCPNRFCAQLYERLLDIFLCLYEITFISWHCFPNTFINVTDHVRKQYDSICAMCAPVTPAIKNVTQGKENGRNGKLLEKTPHEQLLKPSTYCFKSLWYVLWMWERVPWKGPSQLDEKGRGRHLAWECTIVFKVFNKAQHEPWLVEIYFVKMLRLLL